MRSTCLGVLVALLCSALGAPARASDFDGSARFGLGFGGRLANGQAASLLGLSLRGDALTPLRRPGWLRMGPAAELRTASAEGGFRSFEGAAGLALTAALGEDAALSSTTLFGGAYRADRPSTPQLVQMLSLGFRDWESRPRYAPALNLFLALHAAFADRPFYEISGGVEVDFLFLGTPFVLLRDRIRGR